MAVNEKDQALLDNPNGSTSLDLTIRIQNHQLLMIVKALRLLGVQKDNINQQFSQAMSRIVTEKLNEIYPPLPAKSKKAKPAKILTPEEQAAADAKRAKRSADASARMKAMHAAKQEKYLLQREADRAAWEAKKAEKEAAEKTAPAPADQKPDPKRTTISIKS